MRWTDEMIARFLALRAKKIGPKMCAWFMGIEDRDVKNQIRRMKLPSVCRSPFPRIKRDHKAEYQRRVELAEVRSQGENLARVRMIVSQLHTEGWRGDGR